MARYIIVLCFVVSGRLVAQTPDQLYKAVNFDESHGLYDHEIYSLVFDSRGLGWIGSGSGLFIFDGKEVFPAAHFFKMPVHIAELPVKMLLYDSSASTLIAVAGSDSLNIIIYALRFSNTSEDETGFNILLRLSGRLRIEGVMRNNNATFVCNDQAYSIDFVNGQIQNIKKSRPGVREIIYSNGLGYFALAKGDGTLYRLYNEKDSLQLQFFRYFAGPQINEFILYKGIACDTCTGVQNSRLVTLHESMTGICRTAALEKELKHARNFVKDRQGNYFLYGGLGLQKIAPAPEIIQSVRSPIETRSIWYNENNSQGYVAVPLGVYRFDLRRNMLDTHSTAGQIGYYSCLYPLADTAVAFLPMLSRDPALVIQAKTGMVKKMPLSKGPPIMCGLQNKETGTVLLGTKQGLYAGQAVADSFYYGPMHIREGDEVNMIAALPDKRLLLACQSGLYLVDIQKRTERQLRKGRFLSVLALPDGWAGCSWQKGVFIYNTMCGLVKIITTDDGLKSNTVYSAEYDKMNQALLLGTANGLTVYHLPTGISKTFTMQDGLANNEFNRNSTYALHNDSLFIMGGINGLSIINSALLFAGSKEPEKPAVWACEVVYSRKQKQQFYISESGNNIPDIRPGVVQVNLKITSFINNRLFSVLAYKVDKEDWQYMQPGEDLLLIKPSGGLHTVRFRYVTGNGHYSKELVVLFRVKPFWTNTVWGIAIIALVFIGLLAVIAAIMNHYFRLRSIEAINKSREQLFTIISHDLRSPLKSYQGLSETILYLLDINDRERIMEVSHEIDETGRRIELMLNNLLQWSLLQQNKITPVPFPEKLSAIAGAVVAVYEPLARRKNVHLQAQYDPDAVFITDKNIAEMMIRNLLDNAIKNSPPQSTVYFTIQATEGVLKMEIQNQVDPRDMSSLRQLVTNMQHRAWEPGKGVGLRLIMQSVKMLGGTITAELDDDKQTIIWAVTIAS